MPDSNRKNELLYRVYAVLFVFFLLVLAIGYRIVKVSVFEGEEWRSKIEQKSMMWRPLETQRGNIYAEDGHSLMATSVEFFEIRMDPVAPREEDFRNNIDGLANGLAQFDNSRTAVEWKARIVNARKKNSRYLLIAKRVDHFEYDKLRKLPLFNLGRFRGGFRKIPHFSRERPYRDLAARTIGVDREDHRVGLENSFHRLLRGEEK